MNGVLTSHIFRKVNFATDVLVNYAHSLSVGLYIFSSLLVSIHYLLLHDMYGWFIPDLFYLISL